MSFRDVQNPGIGGIDELTTAEELVVQNLAGLSYVQGDALYHNGTNLTRLPIGTAFQVIGANAGATALTYLNVAPRGTLPISTTGGTTTLTATQFQNMAFDVTGTLVSNAIIEIPDNFSQMFVVDNATTGAFTLTVKHVASAAQSIPQGEKVLLYTTGSLVETITTTGTGTGTVTSVSVTTANGVSGTVATATTTPAITLTLGAITPSAIQVSGLTASELLATDASKNLVSLAVATYPSLTELSYVKGVTSAIQTQLGTKAPTTAPTFATSITGSYLTASEMLITDASKNLVSAPVATYPSLTELTYVKGVTSAIQTQLGTKASTALSNLASVAINTTLVSDTDNTDDLGTTLIKWANLFVTTIGATATRVTKGWFTDIESTNMPTVGGTAILTSLTAPQFTTIELGHASDTTLSRVSAGVIAVEGVTVPTISSTSTLTNKRVTKRTGTTTSSATPTINTDNVDEYYITAQAEAITSFTTNLSGTPTLGQTLFISVIGTAARAITWGASFANGPVALPTTTVTTTQLSTLFKWDGSIWRCYATGSTV